jgi:hypothetical protein
LDAGTAEAAEVEHRDDLAGPGAAVAQRIEGRAPANISGAPRGAVNAPPDTDTGSPSLLNAQELNG